MNKELLNYKVMRKKQRITKKVAAAIKKSGKSQSCFAGAADQPMVSKLLSGARQIETLDLLLKISAVLKVNPAVFLN